MTATKLSDSQAKVLFLRWPSSTAELWKPPNNFGKWIRGQPSGGGAAGPRLWSPGASLFSTQPDGLFVYFRALDWCDVVAIEVCGSIQNLNDKRSRYIPSGHSLLLKVNEGWMQEFLGISGGGSRSRWEVVGTFSTEPVGDLSLPVRYLRVLYALPNDLYKKWASNHIPAGHEYFCPHSSLGSYGSQKMQSFLKRMSFMSHFYLAPKAST